VNVRIDQRLREMDAIHAGRGDLTTGTTVRVLRVERAVAVADAGPSYQRRTVPSRPPGSKWALRTAPTAFCSGPA
jgi:hypothetical protein